MAKSYFKTELDRNLALNQRVQQRSRADAQRRDDEHLAQTRQIRSDFAKIKDQHNYFPVGPLSHQSLSRVTYFCSLSEPELGVYVNGGYQKARHAYLAGFRAWNTKYQIGYATITVDLYGRSVRVDVRGSDSFYFEFASSSMPITQTTVSGTPVYLPVVVGVDVKAQGGSLTPSAEIREGRRAQIVSFPQVNDTSIVKRGYQLGLVNEPVSYVFPTTQLSRMRYPQKLYESFAPSHGHHSVHFRNTSWCLDDRIGTYFDTSDWQNYWITEMSRTRLRGGYTPYYLRDINYDVPFSTGENFNQTKFATLFGSADWPRAMGLQRVEHPTYGAREFAVYVDAFSQFWVFPTSQITAWDGVTQNVDSMYVKQVTYTKPSWAFMAPGAFKTYYAGSPTYPLVDYPETDWKPNHNGTKFAAIVYERSAFTYDSTYFGTSTGSKPFDSTKFNALRDQLGNTGRWCDSALQPSHSPQRYFVAPGVIELGVEITLTGPNPEDFSVSGTLREVRRPTTSSRACLAVGYVFGNVPFSTNETTRKAQAGDLVMMDVEQWAKAGVRETPVQLLTILKEDDTVLFSSKAPSQVMAVDLSTLSFVCTVDNYVFDTQAKPNASGGGTSMADMETRHFAVWAVIGLQSRELMFPATMVQERRDELTSLVAQHGFNGRETVEAAGLYRVPLNEARDWTDAAMANARAYLAQESQTGHKSGSVSLTSGIEDTFTQWYWEWATSQPVSFLIYCTAPKFGWQCYADLLCQYMAMGSQVTFMVHPSGTWAYWDNSQIYNPIGACWSATLYAIDQYSVWDPAKIEHCIFDRVHFETRTTKGKRAQFDTTFLRLHNDAVKATAAKGKLAAGIQQIEPADMRATFAKEAWDIGLDTKTYLNILMTWNGGTYQLYDTYIQGGSTGTTFVIAGGLRSIEMSMYGHWSTLAMNVTQPASDAGHYHVRFCNPLVIDAVNRETTNG